MSKSEQHREIVQRLLDSKAVDFTAIGKVIGEVGPSLALSEFEGDGFCGTMRFFIRVFRPGPTLPDPFEDLGELSEQTEL